MRLGKLILNPKEFSIFHFENKKFITRLTL